MINFCMIILEQMLIYLPMVCGTYLSFSLLKVPDLSVETAYLMGAFFGSLGLRCLQGYSPVLILCIALLLAILGGLCVGLLSSCMTVYGKIPHLLSGIMTFGIGQGIFLLGSDAYISLAKYENVLAIMPFVAKHPELMTLMVINVVVLIFFVGMLVTQIGYSYAVYGYNKEFFHHFKISSSYIFITGICIASGLAGLAGFLFAQINNLVEMNMGVGKALFCITSIILGKACFSQNKTTGLVPVVGVVIYFGLQQLLLKIGFNLKYFVMIQSIVVCLILVMKYRHVQNNHNVFGV